MNSVYVPERPDLHEGAPGGFIELTPDGDVVNAFPDLRFVDGRLENALYEGSGLFSVDYNKRLRMLIRADLMTQRTYKCGVGRGPSSSEAFQLQARLPPSHRGRARKLTYPDRAERRDDLRHRCPRRHHPRPSHRRRSAEPVLLQKVPAQHIHVVKFSKDGERLYGWNGIASIIDFQFRNPHFGVNYVIRAWDVLTDGTLVPTSFFVDALDEPGAPPLSNGVFFGDFVLRQNPEIVH